MLVSGVMSCVFLFVFYTARSVSISRAGRGAGGLFQSHGQQRHTGGQGHNPPATVTPVARRPAAPPRIRGVTGCFSPEDGRSTYGGRLVDIAGEIERIRPWSKLDDRYDR